VEPEQLPVVEAPQLPVKPDAAAAKRNAHTESLGRVLGVYVDSATQHKGKARKPSLKAHSGMGKKVVARIAAEGVEAVSLVVRWWQTCPDRDAAWLRGEVDGSSGYTWDTVCGGKFEKYLIKAEAWQDRGAPLDAKPQLSKSSSAASTAWLAAAREEADRDREPDVIDTDFVTVEDQCRRLMG